MFTKELESLNSLFSSLKELGNIEAKSADDSTTVYVDEEVVAVHVKPEFAEFLVKLSENKETLSKLLEENKTLEFYNLQLQSMFNIVNDELDLYKKTYPKLVKFPK